MDRLIPSDAPLEKFVDLPELLARVEDDRELLAELFVLFVEELPGFRDALHRAVAVGNLPEAAKAAHALKGMLANMSMNHGAFVAARFEAAIQAGDLQATNDTLAAFDSEIAALLAAVGAFVAKE
jgi:HPt (histidine-containing phosphotransfer) domain-containing protein